jgi:hypothetical protein
MNREPMVGCDVCTLRLRSLLAIRAIADYRFGMDRKTWSRIPILIQAESYFRGTLRKC